MLSLPLTACDLPSLVGFWAKLMMCASDFCSWNKRVRWSQWAHNSHRTRHMNLYRWEISLRLHREFKIERIVAMDERCELTGALYNYLLPRIRNRCWRFPRPTVKVTTARYNSWQHKFLRPHSIYSFLGYLQSYGLPEALLVKGTIDNPAVIGAEEQSRKGVFSELL
jgi:hypothetical protein